MEKQSSGEFTPADPAAGAQDAALQEREEQGHLYAFLREAVGVA
jgi:hypothetical protein